MQPTRTEPRLSPQNACSSFWREARLPGKRTGPSGAVKSSSRARAQPEPVLVATGLERSSAARAGNDG